MMKHPKSFLILPLVAMMAACVTTVVENQNATDEEPELTSLLINVSDGYTSLDVSGVFEVTTSDSVDQAIITLPKEVAKNLVFKIEESELTIGLKGLIQTNGGIYKAVLPTNSSLNEIELSGASSFHTTHPLRGKEISIDLSGTSSLRARIEAQKVELDLMGATKYMGYLLADHIEVELSGTSVAYLEGETGQLSIDLNGATQLDSRGLESAVVQGELSGTSSADVVCRQLLQVELSGASHITYSGNPSSVATQTSGTSTAVAR